MSNPCTLHAFSHFHLRSSICESSTRMAGSFLAGHHDCVMYSPFLSSPRRGRKLPQINFHVLHWSCLPCIKFNFCVITNCSDPLHSGSDLCNSIIILYPLLLASLFLSLCCSQALSILLLRGRFLLGDCKTLDPLGDIIV